MEQEHCECESEEMVSKIRSEMLNEETIMEISDLFRVFGDSTRVRILWALHGKELCVRGISACLDMSMSAVSHQLKVLKDADLVQSRRDGKNIYYSLCDEHVEILLDTALTHVREDKW